MRVMLIALATLVVGVSGCLEGGSYSNGVDSNGAGQSAEADGKVFFNGVRSIGFSSSRSFDCDESAAVDGFVNGAGSILIEVKDGAGMTVSGIDFDGSGQEYVDENASGTAGSWSIDVLVRPSASNGGGWSGQYSMNVYC